MKVYVIFEFPDIKDQDSEEASLAIEMLQEEIKGMLAYSSVLPYCDWFIHDAKGD